MIALWLGLSAAAAAKPARIMSLNQCTDLLLLQLVPKERIASISYLAHEAVGAVRPGLDAGVPVNHGSAEEVLVEQPDLILAGPFSTAVTRELAREARAPLVEVQDATSFADVARNVREVGRAVGEPGRAEALVAGMDATLAGLFAEPPPRARRIAVWDGGGPVPGRGTLFDAIVRAAGATNVSAGSGAASVSLDLEELLALRPDALLQAAGDAGDRSLRGRAARHPLVRHLYPGRRIAYAEALYTCGLPQSADAALRLRHVLDALPPDRPW